MFFKKNKRISSVRRFKSRDFQNKIRLANNYKRLQQPINLNHKSRWLFILGVKSKFYRIIWIGAAVGLIYLFIFSKFFVINNIEVRGASRVDANQIKDIVLGLSNQRTLFIPQSNVFLLTKPRLAATLTAQQPYIKEIVNYRRYWPNKITVEISERDPGFILQTSNKSYLIDDSGVVVTDNLPNSSLPIVIDQVQENIVIGSSLSNAKLVAFILSIHKQWASKIGSAIRETKIPGKASTEVQFVSADGWAVFFDINRPATAQLNNLHLILSKQILAKDRQNLAYIDMRLSKWAYYCFKNTPCVAGAELDKEPSLETNPNSIPNSEIKK